MRVFELALSVVQAILGDVERAEREGGVGVAWGRGDRAPQLGPHLRSRGGIYGETRAHLVQLLLPGRQPAEAESRGDDGHWAAASHVKRGDIVHEDQSEGRIGVEEIHEMVSRLDLT